MSRTSEGRPLGWFTVAAIACEFAATTVHHVHGGIAFDSLGRLYAAAVFAGIFLLTLLSNGPTASRPRRMLATLLAALFWVGLLGLFEGGYNHAWPVWRQLVGSPVADFRPDLLFQTTGVVTFVAALAVAAGLSRDWWSGVTEGRRQDRSTRRVAAAGPD
ncbi:hypothetical protein [Sphingosinicella sp. CPCC 101087]|uniref:hypothetical protein n=1 Tax=Sphingosinicella sp. CPCC 101087 TaxID=2497754 RepID=UPI00101D4D80|nr:hypothetical protein [Sphingosinicella sp. CPCC 101087]